jgi:transcriptional regulator of NAD metabolism
MTGDDRRTEIHRLLLQSQQPMTGTALAKILHVSRQVIVQDIALMRAEQMPILSTNKGYLLRSDEIQPQQPKRVFLVRHTTEQVLEEFMTVIDLGGRILDVAVEHELYGPIRADLLIENAADARDFVEKLSACRDNPLKVLTDDCHFHTVSAPSEKLLDLIESEFRSRGFLEETP